jgi:anhydro-N-acetylmuramic acid kinase
MSGTSLDGLDITCCTFVKKDAGWSYLLDACETIRYTPSLKAKLRTGHKMESQKLLKLHHEFGFFLGNEVKKFIKKNNLRKIDFVASHGHTIFHQPQNGFTFQLGDGNDLHEACGLPVINDFRSLDVSRGGQGAPLVPIGDHLLFSEYDVCLNLGGIANLSRKVKGERIAYDICYANMGLNYLAQQVKKEYDKGGNLAAQGKVNEKLFAALSKKYVAWHTSRPSLGREDFEKLFLSILNTKNITTADKLCTFTESIAYEIANAINKTKTKSVLVTGGGAFNNFLLYRLNELGGDENQFVLPEENVINFKEAMIFAFLGVLRFRNDQNTFRSVTKARADSSSGVMFGF